MIEKKRKWCETCWILIIIKSCWWRPIIRAIWLM